MKIGKQIFTAAFILSFVWFKAQTTIIPNGSTWKYKDDGSNQGTSWTATSFNDASWSSGPSELGYGDGDEVTVVNACGTLTQFPTCSTKYTTTYFRQTFSVTSVSSYTGFTANLRRDDGIVLYVNGVEVYRNNMPTGTITYTTLASAAASDDGTLVLNATIPASVVVSGTNVVSAEIHQNAGSSSDLSFEFNLVGNAAPVNVATVAIFPNGSTWKYLDDGTNQGTTWYGTGFSDASWASGPSELGYGDGDEATVVNACGTLTQFPTCSNKYTTTYFRKTVNITTSSSYTSYVASFRRDDGIVLYINGAEVYRNNMPTGTITYTTPASTACSDDGATVFSVTVPSSVIVSGTNVIAAEIHQNVGTSSDVTFEFAFTAVTNSIAATIPTIVKGPYLQIVTSNSTTVRWETSSATDSQVMYGTNASSLSSVMSNSTSLTSHIIQLTGLNPYTKYYYSIGSSTVVLQGDTNNYFMTAPIPGTAGNYRFWVTGDCGNASTNQTNCKNQYKTYNGNGITNGWLLLGDNAYSNGTNSEFNAEFFSIYQNDVMKKIPLWPTPGNHDYNNGAATATTVPYFSIFSTPTNGEAGGVASGNPAYYSYDYGNIHFISLDSYGTTGSSLKMYDTTGAQATWVKQDLAANTKKWTIAYWHHPPYTMGSHNSDTEGDLVSIRQNFIRILERNKVDLILCGHSHDYERSKLMNGHYGNESSFNAGTHNLSSSSALYDGSTNSCPYAKDSLMNKIGTVYVLSGSAGQLGGQQTSFPHDAMYYSNATNGGSFILDIQDNKLQGKWLCADGVVRDQFTIFKDISQVKSYTVSPGQAQSLSASWPGNYVWSNASTTRSVSINTSSNLTVWVKDPNNCVADTFKLRVLPAVNFTAASPYCTNNAVQFNDVSTNTPNAWAWSVTPSSGVSINGASTASPFITFGSGGIYTVSLIASNLYGSGLAYSQTLNVGNSPTVTASSSSSAVCASQTLALNATGGTTYLWSTGQSSASVVTTPSANSIYTVTGTVSNGCSSNATISVTVNSLPAITITANPVSAAVCSGSSLTLSGNGASTYTWSGGISNNVSFVPTASSNYTVTATGPNGCTNAAVISTTVNAIPVLSVTASPASATVCQGNTLSLLASGASSYTWTGSVTNGVAFTPVSSGIYTVSGASNGCVGTNTASVTVNALPQLTITGSGTVCAGNSINLNVSGANTYSWSTGVNTASISVSPSVNINYTVIGTSGAGCQSSVVKSVTVFSLPQLTVSSSPSGAITTVCAGNTVVLGATGASSYSWSGGISNNIPFTAIASGTYTVTGIDANGCSAVATKSVQVNALPNVIISAPPVLCVGSSASLTASGAVSYSWSTGQQSSVILVNPAVTTVYSVTGTDLNLCSKTVTTTLTVDLLPVISVSNGTICTGDSFVFSPSGASTYTISGGSMNVSPLSTTSYSILGTSTAGCISQAPAVAMVVVNSKPVLSVSGTHNILCLGETATITVSGANTYTWSNQQNGAAIVVNPIITTLYSVIGQNSLNCSGSAAFTQTVDACTGITGLSYSGSEAKVFPNPNNGSFSVQLNENAYFRIEIYSATGERVYQATLNPGRNDIRLQVAGGIYLYRLSNTAGSVQQGNIVIEN
jgi:hypothetical protein